MIFAISALALALSGPLLTRPAVQPSRSAVVRMDDEGTTTLKCDVRKIPNSAIALDITVPKAVADEIHLKTLAKLAKTAKMDGFRDGKAPPQAVIAKLGLQKVKEATVETIIDVGMTQSGMGQRVQTVGDVRLPEGLEDVAKRYKVGDELAFSVEVDVFPQWSVEESVRRRPQTAAHSRAPPRVAAHCAHKPWLACGARASFSLSSHASMRARVIRCATCCRCTRG